MDKETKGFMIGFMVSVIGGLTTLYIFNEYIAKKAATAAIESYKQKYGSVGKETPKNKSTLTLSHLSKVSPEHFALNQAPPYENKGEIENAFGML